MVKAPICQADTAIRIIMNSKYKHVIKLTQDMKTDKLLSDFKQTTDILNDKDKAPVVSVTGDVITIYYPSLGSTINCKKFVIYLFMLDNLNVLTTKERLTLSLHYQYT